VLLSKIQTMKIKHFLWLLFRIISCSDQDDDYVNLPLIVPNFHLAYDITANLQQKKDLNWVKLFYDGRLASDGLVSCGFCHLQENAFTHHGHTVSHGVNDAVGTRNAPAIQNMAFQRVFMYDGASSSFRSATHHSFDKQNRK
jgi:cytochrome c peroxidase